MPAKSIGKTLKELRLKCGLSQKQAYEYIGVAQSTFSSWEVGKAEPPNEVFLQLCDLYNVDDIWHIPPPIPSTTLPFSSTVE